MKIGSFAKKNHVSIDTIRHYIALQLLIPRKPVNQYEFDVQCQNDFDDILYLKSFGFTLLEIKNIFIVKRLGKMTSFQQEEYYKNIFKEKYEIVKCEIEKLDLEKSNLEEEFHRLDIPKADRSFKMGIDLKCLRYLSCNDCGNSLVLNEAVVENNMVLSGKLKCICGAEFSIEDGILCANSCRKYENQPLNVVSYIQHTDKEYLNRIYKTLEWNVQNINFEDLSGKIVLELGSGSGFFLRRIYDDLPESAIYIAVDYDLGKLRSLKETLEKSEHRKNILFMCCDLTQIPLLPRSIDVLCDYTGTSDFSFEHSDFLLKSIERFYKADTVLLGSYIIFKNFSRNSIVPIDFRPNFQIDKVKKQIEKLGFYKQAEYLSEVVTKGGIYENYFQNGEKIMTYSFIGKRSG